VASTSKQQGLVLSGVNQNGGFSNSTTEPSKINRNLASATDSENPRPSSLHPGVVNMAFGDGSVKPVSQDISDNVYLRLLTPFGGRYGQNVLADTDF
jgi:prepilin-type processing-associated H-X9-DG protein